MKDDNTPEIKISSDVSDVEKLKKEICDVSGGVAVNVNGVDVGFGMVGESGNHFSKNDEALVDVGCEAVESFACK